MPTYREDLHLGHKVSLIEADDIKKGAITTDKISDGAVTTDKLADDAITNEKIADNTIEGRKLADNTITFEKLVDGTLTGEKFQDNTIPGDKIQDNTVSGEKLMDGTIENVDIKDNTLSGEKIKNNTIEGIKIKDDTIESRHLMDNSIPGEKIKDGTIENVDIKDNTLDGSKIKDNTIQGAKLADNAIDEDKLVDDSVSGTKLQDNSIGAAKVVDGSINGAKLADGAVETAKIANGAITEGKLANGAVTTEKLADGMIEQLQTITDAEPTPNSVKPLQSGGAAAVLGHYIDNPEFVKVYTDAEDKILWGIQADGNIYFGVGCPQQVKDYIEEKISSLSLDEYEDIVAFLDGFIGSDTTLQAILESLNITIEKKVDKEEGKSLIDEEYANGIHYIENPEFIEVELDAGDKVLEGRRTDGRKLINGGTDMGGDVSIDGNLSVRGAIDQDGCVTELVDNTEYIEAKVDANGKFLEGFNRNGEKIFGVIPPQIKQYIDENMPIGGSGVQSIEYDEETGDMYATYDDESGVTDVSMDPNGDIYVEYDDGE